MIVDTMRNHERTIQKMLACSLKEAKAVYDRLKTDYDVYTYDFQVILCEKGADKILYNFEKYGQTFWQGHKYNSVNEWDFRNFVSGGKIKTERKKRPKKALELICTEIQMKRANQLWYAHSIGFDVNYKDYQRFYLV